MHVFGRSVGIARRSDSLAGKEFGNQCRALAIVLARILVRNQFEKNFRRGIAHKAGEVTFGVVLEAAARRVGRLVVHLRQLQRPGVHEGGVAAAMLHQHRTVGHGLIEIMAIEGARSLPVVVQEPKNPLSRRRLLRALMQCCLYFFDGVPVAGHFVQMLDA